MLSVSLKLAIADVLGQPRPFAFLTLETTPAQLRKCELYLTNG